MHFDTVIILDQGYACTCTMKLCTMYKGCEISLRTTGSCFCRALEGHTHGDLPWAWCDEGLDDQMGTLVGEYCWDFFPDAF